MKEQSKVKILVKTFLKMVLKCWKKVLENNLNGKIDEQENISSNCYVCKQRKDVKC